MSQRISDLEAQIYKLNKGKMDLEQTAVDTRILVFEVAERHDVILKLKSEVNDLEEKLKQMDTHIQFKDEIIKDLRKGRINHSKVGDSS